MRTELAIHVEKVTLTRRQVFPALFNENYVQVKKLLLVLLFICIACSVWAQRVITGKVTDARDNTPLVGVNITVKGSKTGTTTDQDGNYRISAQANATLIFSNI